MSVIFGYVISDTISMDTMMYNITTYQIFVIDESSNDDVISAVIGTGNPMKSRVELLFASVNVL